MIKLLVCVSLGIALLGCRGEDVAQVTGTVRLDGQPVPGAQVTFHPVAEGRPAYGTAATEGIYRLRVGDIAGALPGEYRVTVIRHGAPPPTPPGGMPSPGPLLTPAVYSSVERTPLTFRVALGENTIDLDLTSHP